jgi:hypothetical protein
MLGAAGGLFGTLIMSAIELIGVDSLEKMGVTWCFRMARESDAYSKVSKLRT